MKVKKVLTYKHDRPVYTIKVKKFLFWHTEVESYDQHEIDRIFRKLLRCDNVEKA